MLLSTQSNAFSRLQIIPPIVSLLFKAFKISFNNLNTALSVVEFDLKSNCSFDSMLFSYYMFITIHIDWLCIRMFKIFRKKS